MGGSMKSLACHSRIALTPLFVVLVLFGLPRHSLAEQQKTDHNLRRRSVTETITSPRNTYWDLPPTATKKSAGLDNSYWQLSEEIAHAATDAPKAEAEETAHAATTHDVSKAKVELSSSVTMYHAAKTVEKSSNSTLQTVSDENSSFRDEIMFMTQDIFVSQCLERMEGHADNGRLNRDHYVSFLQEISKGTLEAQDFTDLPLFLAMIFFSASCSSGEDCVTQEPAISLLPTGTRENSMNQVLCHQLMRFPFMEILLPFQFLIRVNNGLSASDVMVFSEHGGRVGDDENEETAMIVPNLEGALDQALLRGFNCSYVPGEPIRYSRRKKKDSRPKRQQRQPQPQGDCDFVVDVTVEDAADYPCGFQSSCILIFSDVTVYAVLNESLDEPTLRRLTTDVLRDAINGDALNAFL